MHTAEHSCCQNGALVSKISIKSVYCSMHIFHTFDVGHCYYCQERLHPRDLRLNRVIQDLTLEQLRKHPNSGTGNGVHNCVE